MTEGSVAAKYPCPGDSFYPVGILRKTTFEGANRSFRFGSKAGDKSGPQLLRCGPHLQYMTKLKIIPILPAHRSSDPNLSTARWSHGRLLHSPHW